jgi:hypothetical protein
MKTDSTMTPLENLEKLLKQKYSIGFSSKIYTDKLYWLFKIQVWVQINKARELFIN